MTARDASTRKSRLGWIAAIAFVATQFIVPTLLWNQPYGFFQWRMFSGGDDIRAIEMTDDVGRTTAVEYREISSPRAEISADAWASAMCDYYPEAVFITVTLQSETVGRRC